MFDDVCRVAWERENRMGTLEDENRQQKTGRIWGLKEVIIGLHGISSNLQFLTRYGQIWVWEGKMPVKKWIQLLQVSPKNDNVYKKITFAKSFASIVKIIEELGGELNASF